MARANDTLKAFFFVAMVVIVSGFVFRWLGAGKLAMAGTVIYSFFALLAIVYVQINVLSIQYSLWFSWGVLSWFSAVVIWPVWAQVALESLAYNMNGGGRTKKLFGEPSQFYFPEVQQEFLWNSSWFKISIELFFVIGLIIAVSATAKRWRRGW
ncbi:MAG: hypothetical protein KKH22_12020 [Proteobacteria bacterium]|nr:hypothetical protein [Pseudomonadota bacterium]